MGSRRKDVEVWGVMERFGVRGFREGTVGKGLDLVEAWAWVEPLRELEACREVPCEVAWGLGGALEVVAAEREEVADAEASFVVAVEAEVVVAAGNKKKLKSPE